MYRKQALGATLLLLVFVILFTAGLESDKSKEIVETEEVTETTTETTTEAEPKENEIFVLSRTEKNVVVITLDRGLGFLFPYILQEKPELREQFSGFTYYPYTLSYGAHTIYGMPPIFGGYEYTPEAMNARTDLSLREKHNEALLMLPLIFTEAGYSATVCDPPIANYSWTPDLSIFDDYEDIKAYNTIGMYEDEEFGTSTYWQQQELYSWCYAYGANTQFMQNYLTLKNFSNMTIARNTKGAYISITNEITHRYTLLQKPDYVPSLVVDNSAYDSSGLKTLTVTGETIDLSYSENMATYHVNMCAMLLLGEWFDYLKELGVYDNTRIIITSDHGHCMGLYPDRITESGYDTSYFNPILLVKDFDSDGKIKMSSELMTNADVPLLATEGIIEDATNPFTGNKLKDTASDKSEVHVYKRHNWEIEYNQGNDFGSDNYFIVKNNIFDLTDNWKTREIIPKTRTTTEEETTTAEEVN